MKENLVAETWRLERSRYDLIGNFCEACNQAFFPDKQVCIYCGTEDLKEQRFSNKGKLVEWTKIHDVASGFEIYSPIYYAIVELEEGVKISCQLTGVSDDEKLVPGTPIFMVFRKLFEDSREGVITYGFKAQPQTS